MSQNSSGNNKRIAKNTALLYFRMLLTMCIGLFTSRVVLDTLGAEDYGIYNVVGGLVTMFAFLNSAMIATSQRFISFELGKGNQQKLKEVFSTTLTIHIVIAFVIILLSEIIGVWFLNTRMNISPDRMLAANWVFQLSIFSFAVNVVSVPYNASIVAHEKMNAFAYISILEVGLKLAVAYLLLISSYDKLIVYAVLLFLVSLFLRLLYGWYCSKHFEECHYMVSFDSKQFKDMFSFAGWSLVGNLGFSFKDQFSNILLNLFFGTFVNAARGVAMQVASVINGFSTNFMMAVNPQITKSYASGDWERSKDLVYAGCKFSFYLLAIVSLPVMVNLAFILKLWLVDVPQYTEPFLQLALWCSLLYSISAPLTTAMQATGKIKWFQIIICIIMLMELPIAYVLLRMGNPPYFAMYASVLVTVVGVIARILLVKRLISLYNVRYYLLQIFFKSLIIVAIPYCLGHVLTNRMNGDSFFSVLLIGLLIETVLLLLIYSCGLTSSEREMVAKYFFQRIRKKR